MGKVDTQYGDPDTGVFGWSGKHNTMTLSPQDLRSLAAYRSLHGTAEGFVPTQPKKKRKNEEFTMQAALISWWADYCKEVDVPEFLLWHTPNSAVYGGTKEQREKMGAMLKRLGQRSGVPDLFLAWPRPDSGTMEIDGRNGLFIELKAPKGIVSDEQTTLLAELQKQGFQTAVCRTLEDAQKVITNYLSP